MDITTNPKVMELAQKVGKKSKPLQKTADVVEKRLKKKGVPEDKIEENTVSEIIKMLESIESRMFRGKVASISNNQVKLFFKKVNGEDVFLIHKRDGKNYLTCWERDGIEYGKYVSSGKPLSVSNTSFENKIIEVGEDFANKKEINDFLNEAGNFVIKQEKKIFSFKSVHKRTPKEQMLLDIKTLVNNKFKVVIDKNNYHLCIYNINSGIYDEYDEREFSFFLRNQIDFELFEDEVKKIMGLFNDVKKESDEYVAFKNCLLNVNTLETRDFTPKIFVKFQVPYNWNTKANSPFFKGKIREILDDDNKFKTFFEMVGYCFTNNNPHNKMFLFIGNGANGKSLLMDLIRAIFDKSHAAVPLQDFNKEFGLAPLIGCKINLLSDLPSEEIRDTGKIKIITGEDSLTINRKYKDPITTKLGCKFIGAGNTLPKIDDNSFAFWRRMIVVWLDKRFMGADRDPHLKEKLITDTAGMEWLIYTSVTAYKKIKATGWSEDTLNEVRLGYMKKSDPAQYAATLLYTVTKNKDDFISREDVITDIDICIDQENEKDGAIEEIQTPGTTQEYYDAIRKIGAIEGSKKINGTKIRGFRYIKKVN